MKRIAQSVLATVMLVGSAAAIATPASAEISFGIGFGNGYYGQRYQYSRAYCDPYSRYYDPYYCDDYDYYYGPPLYVGGSWYSGPIRSRWYHGNRQFWVHDRWHRSDGWRGSGNFRRGHDGYGRGRGQGRGHGGGRHR